VRGSRGPVRADAERADAVCPGGRAAHSGNVLAMQGLARKVHPLGPRVFYELLCEISRSLAAGEVVFGIVERYAEHLTPEMLAVTSTDRFPPAPLGLVGGEP